MTPALLIASAANAGQLSDSLEALINAQGLGANDVIKVLVVMEDPAGVDMTELDAQLRAARATRAERHRQVMETLRGAATQSQRDLVADLQAGLYAGQVLGFTEHWLINGLVVRSTVDGVLALAARADVEVVEPNLVAELIEPTSRGDKVRAGGVGQTPGLMALEAVRVWNELGIDGTGALVGNIDTGVDGTHPALASRWRGNVAPASECWRDALGGGTTSPSDGDGHGTHVMGTITGFTPADSIGVAPGALWIADNSINQDASPELDNDVLGALEWFTDPDGDPLTTDDVPDVVQNSWGVNESFGYPDCDSRWWAAIDNCEAAGVVLTWSAGNEGPGGTSLRSPADRAADPYNAFSVGSTLAFPPYEISSFSSRGPSGCGGPHATKPEVVAPGSDIESSFPGGGYGFLSGTSMAGPHVAGVVALMRSANPDIDVQTIKLILMDTATDLGPVGEENTYGHGIVNAYEAVLAALTGYGTLEGVVSDQASGSPIAGATINVPSTGRYMTSNATGSYQMFLEPGTYTVEFSAFGYVSNSSGFTIVAGAATNGDMALVEVPSALLSGTVTDVSAVPIGGATVTVLNTPISPVTSQADGTYQVSVPDQASYDVRAWALGYGSLTKSVAMAGATTLDFALEEQTHETFETGDFTFLPWTFGGSAPWTIDTTDPYEGIYCSKSGHIADEQVSWMELDMHLLGGGDVKFHYRVDSEASWDYLEFYIDGSLQDRWAGNIPWTEASFPVSAGDHTFRWEYDKDFLVSVGADAAWVDLVMLPPYGTSAGLTTALPAPPAARLLGARPNPFRSDTSIYFELPETGEGVHLAVFDVNGRLVKKLTSNALPAGPQAMTWDGRDHRGRAVAPGIYFYRLTAGAFEATRSIVRVR